MRRGPLAAPPRPFNKLPRRNRLFVDEYVKTGDVIESYRKAGYKVHQPSALQLRRKMAVYISERLTHYLTSADMAIFAVRQLRELAENSDSDAVKLSATKEILSKCGYDAPKEVTVTHEYKHLTNEEVDLQIKEIQAQLVGTPLALEGETIEGEVVEQA